MGAALVVQACPEFEQVLHGCDGSHGRRQAERTPIDLILWLQVGYPPKQDVAKSFLVKPEFVADPRRFDLL
jgi:hypothetical protein